MVLVVVTDVVVGSMMDVVGMLDVVVSGSGVGGSGGTGGSLSPSSGGHWQHGGSPKQPGPQPCALALPTALNAVKPVGGQSPTPPAASFMGMQQHAISSLPQ